MSINISNPITTDDLKQLIISVITDYLKNNPIVWGGGAKVTGNLTVDNNINAGYIESANKIGVRDKSGEGGEVVLYNFNKDLIIGHIDIIDNRLRIWAEVPATDTTPPRGYEVAYWDLTKKATGPSN